MEGLFGVRVTGPLTPYTAGFADELARVGYTWLSTRDQLALVAHFSRWLEGEGLAVSDAAEAAVEAFLVARRAAGYHAHLNAKSLVPLLAYLRGPGVLPPVQVAPLTPLGQALERFRGYLLDERGLTPAAARGYVDLVRPFVSGRVGELGVDPQLVTAGGGHLVHGRRVVAAGAQDLAAVGVGTAIAAAVLASGGSPGGVAGRGGSQGRLSPPAAAPGGGTGPGRGDAGLL